jgi:Tol biopolymer transport system component
MKFKSIEILVPAFLCSLAWSQTTERVSVNSAGEPANDLCGYEAISGNGRFVVFESHATNLVSGVTNNAIPRVYVHDTLTGTTTCVSRDITGTPDHGTHSALSDDGRYVAFNSDSSTLVASDTNGEPDVFVHDRQTGVTELVSVSTSGVQGDLSSPPNSPPAVSADGRYVAFQSFATTLVAGDTNDEEDIFVRDLQTGVTERVSVDSTGMQGNTGSEYPALSADGRFVAFNSAASFVADDTNGVSDVYVHDRQTGTTERVSLTPSDEQLVSDVNQGPSISADGRYVVFSGNGMVLLRDRALNTGEMVSYWAGMGAISADGNSVAYESYFASSITRVCVKDRQTALTTFVSINSAGLLADDNCWIWPRSVSADGTRIVFRSGARNLVPNDTSGSWDVFLHDRVAWPPPLNYCTAKLNSASCLPSIVFSGTASASAGSGFVIGAEQVLAQRLGLLVYGVSGPDFSAFYGGWHCVKLETRTPIQISGSTGSPPCTGTYAYDFNQRIASGVDPTLAAGQRVWTQYWMRDGAASSGGNGLTNGLTFVIRP